MILKKSFIDSLYLSPQSVFSSKEIAILTKEADPLSLKSKLAYYVRRGKLVRLRKGFYAKPEKYEKKEFAVRLYTPSYISFETVLAQEGIIFQYYATIFVASYVSREIQLSDATFRYRKVKDAILLNRKGIVDKDGFFEASKERAFLDMLYSNPKYYFDNLRSIDWDACFDLVSLYQKKSLEKTLKEYYNLYAK
ncbi:MAG: hypothetical protein IPN70_04815 [Candidatus Moraniibacteriota bacterium]|nr:MAG: hypothetical protein IPN70_04815 [Candidatus Moranbacteria bacterium]